MTDFGARVDAGQVVASGEQHSSDKFVDISDDHAYVRPPLQLTDSPRRQESFYERITKPAIDIVGAAVLMLVLAPLMLAVAFVIRATMGSPVILKQPRAGRHGKVFTLYKFRTMEPDRRTQYVPFIGEDRRRNHKDPNDPRLTSVGRFLRKWSLDELPQFFNVLLGEMSLVGPRPEMVQIVAQYEPWQHQRHAVKPGITGPWQISERGDKPLHECTGADLAYIEQISVWTDFKILVMTPFAALGLRPGS